MRFAVTTEHRDFLNKNHYIEFEEMLSCEAVAALRNSADSALSKKLRVPAQKLGQLPQEQLFQAGYDLWRDSPEVKKVTQKNSFATIAAELFEVLPLRYAFDQYIYTTQRGKPPFLDALPLGKTSCLHPLAGAVILMLNDLMAALSLFPLPLNAGSALYIAPSLPIPWEDLFAIPDLHLMIIGFGSKDTAFCPDTCDPNAVKLKKLGYVFNERLKEALHPTLLRRPH